MRRVLATALVCALFYACSSPADAPPEDDAELPPRGEAGVPPTVPPDPPPPPPAPPPIGDAGKDAPVEIGCDGGPSCERVVFATKGGFNGNQLGGIAGADAKCNAAASSPTAHARVKGRTFKAWISITTGTVSSVKDRLVHGTGHYVKPGGTIVANDWSDLTDGTLQSGIDQDETGAPVTGHAWTGTTIAGLAGPNQCDGWGPSGNQGRTGNVGGAMNGWTDGNDDGCGTLDHLYCFEQ